VTPQIYDCLSSFFEVVIFSVVPEVFHQLTWLAVGALELAWAAIDDTLTWGLEVAIEAVLSILLRAIAMVVEWLLPPTQAVLTMAASGFCTAWHWGLHFVVPACSMCLRGAQDALLHFCSRLVKCAVQWVPRLLAPRGVAQPTSAVLVVVIVLFVLWHSAATLRTNRGQRATAQQCCICFETGAPATGGVACDAGHYLCRSCFSAHVRSRVPGAGEGVHFDSLRREGRPEGGVLCLQQTRALGDRACNAPAYSENAVSGVLLQGTRSERPGAAWARGSSPSRQGLC